MVRIVCQVLQQPDRVTFVWSQDDAPFEPYHLDAAETGQFYQAGQRTHEQLTKLLAGSDAAKEPLARAGNELYQLIFRTQAGSATPARKVEQWLHGLKEASGSNNNPWVSSVASFEVVTDAPGRIPWNAVYEESLKSPLDVHSFWGVRYPITSGRRVNPLRLSPFIGAPDVLQVLDPALPADQRDLWRQGSGPGTWRSVSTPAELKEAMLQRSPDLLCWVGGVKDGQLTLGNAAVSLADLRTWIEDADDGSTEPIFLLHPHCANDGEYASFFRQAAFLLPGLITWEAPPTPKLAGTVGHTCLERLRAGGAPLGQRLRELRQKEGWAGLGLTAFCPPEIFFGELPPDVELGRPRVFTRLPAEPYLPLASLDAEERPLLAGRDRDVFRLASLLDDASAGLFLVHGSASVGKTSFLQAGVLPYLENDAVGFLAMRDRTEPEGAAPDERDCPVVAVRASRDLAGQLAEALCVFCAEPFLYKTPATEIVTVPLPALLRQAVRGDQANGAVAATAIQKGPAAIQQGQGILELGPAATSAAPAAAAPATESELVDDDLVEPVELWENLDKDPTLLGRLLELLSRNLPNDVVVLIEQGEEVFTQAKNDRDEKRRGRALKMLALAAESAPRCKIILSLRSDFLGPMLSELAGSGPDAPSSISHVRDFYLPELNREQLLEALLLPTATEPIMHTGEVPHNKYKLAFDEKFAGNLVDQICTQAEKSRQSPIAVLHVVAHSLYERARKRSITTLDNVDLKIVGGVENALGKLVDTRLNRLDVARSLRKTLRTLLIGLCTSHADGTVTRDTFSIEEMEQSWSGRKPDAAKAILAAEGAGLIEMQHLLIDGSEGAYASLPQDSLARVTQDWVDQKKTAKLAGAKIIDQWFLALPLVILCSVISWRVAEHNLGPKIKELQEEIEAIGERYIGMVRPKYLGDLARAEQAWQTGAIDRMRKDLLTHQVLPTSRSDQRGFEWYYLWNLANSERMSLKGHMSTVNTLAVSPDGKVCASGSLDDGKKVKIFLWDLASGKKRATLLHDSAVEAVAFSTDGKYLVTAGAAKAEGPDQGKFLLNLWDAQAGEKSEVYLDKPRVLEGHTSTILALACPRAPVPPPVKIDKVQPLKTDKDLQKETGGKDAKKTDDAKKPSEEGTKPKDGKADPKPPSGPSLFASAGADKTIIIWDLSKDDKSAKLHTLTSKDAGPLQALAFVSITKAVGGEEVVSMTRVAAGDAFGKVFLWDLADPKKTPSAFAAAKGPIHSLAFLPNGKTLLAGGTEPLTDFGPAGSAGFIRTLNPASGEILPPAAKHGSDLFAIALSPDGKTLASAGKDNFIRLWDAGTLKELGTIKGHMGWIRSLAFAPDGHNILSGSFDRTVKVWRPAPSELSEVFLSGAGPMSTLAISADNKLLAAGGKQGKVYLWNLVTGRLLKTPFAEFSGSAITAVSFHNPVPSGLHDDFVIRTNRLAIAAKNKDEGTIQVWDITEDKDQYKIDEVLSQKGKGKAAACLAISPDGKFIAWSSGKNIERWDLGKKEKLPELTGSETPVHLLAVSPDNNSVAGVGTDGKIRIWNVESGKEIATSPLKGHQGAVLSMTYPHKQQIITGGADRMVRIWLRGKEDKIAEISYRSSSAVLGVAFASGPQIFQAGADNIITLVTPRKIEGKEKYAFDEIYTLRGHTGQIRAMVISTNDQILASTGDDGTVRVWRAPLEVKE